MAGEKDEHSRCQPIADAKVLGMDSPFAHNNSIIRRRNVAMAAAG
jgi:hypothetical protein